MARTFTGGATPYLSKTGSTMNYPLSISVWVKETTFNYRNIIGVCDSTGQNYFAIVESAGGSPGGYCLETNASGSIVDDATSANSVSTGTWAHICGVWTNATSRALFVNGTKTTATASKSPTGTINVLYLGAINTLGSIIAFSGSLAFAGVWNVALSDQDVTSLSQGKHPKGIQPSHLVACCDMEGDASPEPDLILPTGWTLTGSPAKDTNPRIFL